jgi:hypothetical protein
MSVCYVWGIELVNTHLTVTLVVLLNILEWNRYTHLFKRVRMCVSGSENKRPLSTKLIVLYYVVSWPLNCQTIVLSVRLCARVLYSRSAAFFQLLERIMSWSDKMSPVLSSLRVSACGDMWPVALHCRDYGALVSWVVHFGEGFVLDSVVDAAHVGAFFEFLGKGGVLLEDAAVVVLGR